MAGQNKVISQVMPLAEKAAVENGCELLDIEYQKEGSNWVLRVYIDREIPIDHDACQAVSEQLSEALNILDPISHEYMLEISSPGVERALKKPEHFQRFAGEKAKCNLYAPWQGQKEYEGILLGLNDNKVGIKTAEGDIWLPFAEIASAHLVFTF